MTKSKSILMGAFVSLLALGATSCDDSFLFDKEGDCSVKVQFVFKKHRQSLHSLPGKEADAFYSTVNSIHLFIYDTQNGNLVYEKIESVDNLKNASELSLGSGIDRCYLPVDLAPGKYRLVVWCGLDETDSNNAFYLHDGSTRAKYAECSVKHNPQGHPVNTAKYDGLFHGTASAEINVLDGKTVIPVELTKNTNDIAVWVQHTSQTFDKGDYEVVYTDANGSMHFDDNSITRKDRLEYHPHSTSVLSSSTEYNGDKMETGALVAHISTSRLMEANAKDAKLEVRDKEGNTVFSIPFIQYVLNLQTFTNDSQHYLDCEDTYNCSFYLTGDKIQDGTWTPARIIINNWVVVPDQESGITGD